MTRDSVLRRIVRAMGSLYRRNGYSSRDVRQHAVALLGVGLIVAGGSVASGGSLGAVIVVATLASVGAALLAAVAKTLR